MSESIKCENPLVRCGANEWQAPKGEVTLRERPFLGYLNLRGNPKDEAFREAVGKVLGLALPLEPNTTAGHHELAAFWLAPNEWMLVTPTDAQGELARSLEQALEGQHVAVTDVSGSQCAIAISGPRARDLLAKGCGLDLHPRAFAPGQCAQSLVAKAGVLICHWDEPPSFELFVRRSFSEYLWNWLQAAARSFPEPA
jgi:sarcosine oxidase subunit gamma